jgi:head-tail adaptor
MPTSGERNCAITFIAAATSTNDYNETVEDWAHPTTLASVTAQVIFGSGQEKREAAQQAAQQTASFVCYRSSTLDAVPMTARITFDGSQWGITVREPLDRYSIRFTAIRLL